MPEYFQFLYCPTLLTPLDEGEEGASSRAMGLTKVWRRLFIPHYIGDVAAKEA